MIFVDDEVLLNPHPSYSLSRIYVPRNSRTLLPVSSDGLGNEDEDAEEVDQAARPGREGGKRACIPQNQFAGE